MQLDLTRPDECLIVTVTYSSASSSAEVPVQLNKEAMFDTQAVMLITLQCGLKVAKVSTCDWSDNQEDKSLNKIQYAYVLNHHG